MSKNIERIREYIILGIIFLVPITFAGTFIDKFQLPKLIILGLLICLTLLITAFQIYFAGKYQYGKGKFDLAVFVIVLAYLISAIVITPNKMEAFFLPGNASFIVGFGIVYFLVNTIADKSKIKITMIASSVVLSLFIFGNFLGIFEKIPQLPAYLKLPLFNPAGDYLTGIIFLVATIPFAIFFMIKENDLVKKLIVSFSLVFILIATGISVFTLVTPDKKAAPILPPYQTSWNVGISTIGESPLLGIGPGNYLTAFNRFRPITYNSISNLWQLRFSTGRDWYLTVLTEAGLLGILGVALLIFSIFKIIDRNISIYKESRGIMIDILSMAVLVGVLITFLVFPATAPTLMLLFVLLAINSQPKMHLISLEGHNHQTPRAFAAVILVGLVIFIGFKTRPLILAESTFKQANDALSANNGKKTYDLLQQAINLNPLVDRYHASYAQVNLAIARSVVTSETDPKNLTDDQKNTISQLIQQAIREGQNTVSLNPTRAANWQVMANIYQIIIPYANQADQYAIQSYNQTINLDPTDPNLRISLGGLYYSLGQYDNAISTLQFAAIAKPDLANAYYNLASAYAAKNDFTNAIAAMNKVISLLPKDSSDVKTAQTDLETLQKKQKSLGTPDANSSLTTPEKQETNIKPQLDLPSEATPPAAPKLPTPTPSATPETTPIP